MLPGLFALSHGFTLAGTGSCVGAGAINVSAPVVGECGLDNGDSLSVTSGGSITGDGLGASVGVRVGAGVTGVRITNDGTIAGSPFDAIWNMGSIDSIVNRGTLQGGSAFALGVYNLGTITVLNNEASGVISGTSTWPNVIESTGTLGTLNNAGRILGGIQTTGTTLNLLGTSSRITGAVANTAGSIRVLSGAVFTTENTFNAATFQVLSGGRLNIGASTHTITLSSGSADAFNNAGTLYVPVGVQGQISGNYKQTGTLRIGATSAAAFGRLNVTGNATLDSGARFEVDVNAFNTLSTGQTLAGVLSASGTLTNSAPATNVVDNSALFNFESSVNGSAIDLDLVAAGGSSSSSEGVVPAVTLSNLLNGVPAARVLDGYVRGGVTGTDWDSVVTALGRQATNRDVAVAVGQAMPLLHGNAALAALAHSAASNAAVEAQLAGSGQSGGASSSGRSLWVKPVGNWVHQDGRDGANGYEVGTYGLVGGVQQDVGTAAALGLGVAYLQGNVDGEGFAENHRSDMESVQLMGYGRYALNDTGLQLTWRGDYTRSRVESRRSLAFIGRTAQARYFGDAWHLGLGLSWAQPWQGMTVRPLVALDWRQYASEAYTEDGAGALNLQVNAQKAREAILKVGAQVQKDFNTRTQWLTRAAVGADLSGQANTVTARFTGGGVAFTTEGLPRSRMVAEFGLGLRHRPSERMEISARYDLRLRKGLRDQTASVRLAWMF
ncbi:autotransporter outer membrane beta-barrel domain-containing protein [Hydrogenophaga sp.]|uniref:autotransporter outer membrane beta-barrel domain-containing protein n=1 Tax=Hydrogenophaga sp. TaxID=1904254 RepID=UPI003D13AF64